MSIIDEDTAWEILQRYVRDCLRVDSCSLLGIYAIGSLPGGYYRPGESDIDAVLTVKNGSEHIWGSSDRLSEALHELNHKYSGKYQIPKDFGPFPIQKGELFRPYDPEKEMTLEIARLKLQGRCIYGGFALETVPMPTGDDFLRDVQHFEEWWRDEFSKRTPLEKMSPGACVNTILMHLSRFLRIKRGIIEFDKCKLMPKYLENDPPFVDHELLHLVEEVIEFGQTSEAENEPLRQYAGRLRLQMNAYLGISI